MARSSLAFGALVTALVMLHAGVASARTSRRITRRVHYVALRAEPVQDKTALLAPAPLRPVAVGGLTEGLQKSAGTLDKAPAAGQAAAEPAPPANVPAAATAATPSAPAAPPLATGPRAVASVGMKLAQQFSAPYLRAGQQRIATSFQDDPVLTGILVGGAAIVGIGAYVGLQAARDGRVEASPSISLGNLRLGVSGGYDFANGAWQGLVRLDLSKLVDSTSHAGPDALADLDAREPMPAEPGAPAALPRLR